MSDDLPLASKLRLIFLAACRPRRFVTECSEYRPTDCDPKESAEAWELRQVRYLRSAWFNSFFLICVTAVLAVPVGQILARYWGSDHFATYVVGGIGGLVVLWATLALRGWEIQTMDGSTLAEAVNKWMYRGACTVGTFLIVASASWSVG